MRRSILLFQVGAHSFVIVVTAFQIVHNRTIILFYCHSILSTVFLVVSAELHGAALCDHSPDLIIIAGLSELFAWDARYLRCFWGIVLGHTRQQDIGFSQQRSKFWCCWVR